MSAKQTKGGRLRQEKVLSEAKRMRWKLYVRRRWPRPAQSLPLEGKVDWPKAKTDEVETLRALSLPVTP